MLIFLVLFISTFFSVFHLISSCRFRNTKVLYNVDHKGITILVPCYNEARILEYTIEGLLKVHYDNLEVIFINDGSKDETFEELDKRLKLHPVDVHYQASAVDGLQGIYQSDSYPYMYVIDKNNSGKANSLNVGIEFAKKDLILTMDCDCVLEKNALLNMNTLFEDEDIIASGGVVHIMQMSKLDSRPSLVVMIQALDYIKGFYLYKASLAYHDALSIISGAFGVFRRDTLVEIGGFRASLGEDIDITLRLQEYAKRNNKKVVFNKNAICYTECPEKLLELFRQRVRWQKGFIDAILRNKSYLFNSIFKSNLCFFIIIDALISNSFATVVFIMNLVLIVMKLVYGYTVYTVAYYLFTLIFSIVCSVVSIRLAKQNITKQEARSLYHMILYDVVFFQFLRIFFFLVGTVTYFFSDKHWYKVNRSSNIYKI